LTLFALFGILEKSAVGNSAGDSSLVRKPVSHKGNRWIREGERDVTSEKKLCQGNEKPR
jgi:hypothetical protein